jgi:hypothetical protein
MLLPVIFVANPLNSLPRTFAETVSASIWLIVQRDLGSGLFQNCELANLARINVTSQTDLNVKLIDK